MSGSSGKGASAETLRGIRPSDAVLCEKCRKSRAQSVARQGRKLCAECLVSAIAKKVSAESRMGGLVGHGDRLVAGLSGGAGSSAMLEVLKSFQSVVVDRPERGKVVYDLVGVHVDEAGAHGASGAGGARDIPPHARRAVEAVQALHGGPRVRLAVVRLEWALSAELLDRARAPSADGPSDADVAALEREPPQELTERLLQLLGAVRDETGREDLIAALRGHLLATVCRVLRCNKLALGESATRMAINALCDSAKGRGYSMTANTRWCDARLSALGLGPTVVRPMQEVTSRELCQYGRHHGLPNAPPYRSLQKRPFVSSSINSIVENFLGDMQDILPSSASTVLKTCSKLMAFQFNEVRAAAPAVMDVGHRSAPHGMQVRQEREQAKRAAASSAGIASSVDDTDGPPLPCAICTGPLSPHEVQQGAARARAADDGAHGDASARDLFDAAGCDSCREQILDLPVYLQPRAQTRAQGADPAPFMPPGMLELARAVRTALAVRSGASAAGADPVCEEREAGAAEPALRRMEREEMRAALEGWLLEDQA
ncbi:unnamed protein product [Pedinophyceae sp. YPF-701]|nr:unnamed protein product [Pedinophyceae sp. YPF-701]